MTLRKISFAIPALMALAPVALAQADKAPQMPKPAPEMKQLDFFQGSWSCEGSVPATPFGPAGKTTSSVTVHDDLGGFWQSGRVKAAMPNQPPMEGMFHTTYDPAAKAFMMLWVDNTGVWARSTSKGWSGDTIVYEGEMQMGGQTMRGRDGFVKTGPAAMKHTMEMQLEGKWTPMGEELCHKTK